MAPRVCLTNLAVADQAHAPQTNRHSPNTIAKKSPVLSKEWGSASPTKPRSASVSRRSNRLAKKARLRWKRVRKSFKSLSDPRAFAKGKRALEALHTQEEQGKIARYYFDASGFALDPTMPYAWQEPKSVIALPAMR